MNTVTDPVTPRPTVKAAPNPTVKVTPHPDDAIDNFLDREYTAGFVTDIESVTIPKGLSEETIRFLSSIKQEPEFMLEWRLAA